MTGKTPDTGLIAEARALVRRARSASLGTALTGRRKGWPYVSLVSVACAADASPLLLISTLADHTRNLADDDRASLLFEEAGGLANPQAAPRVTLTGRLKPTGDEALARRFLARHPGAALYAGFADFGFYRMEVERAHYVGGFGTAKWFAAKAFLFDQGIARSIAVDEERMLRRLEGDLAEDLARAAGKAAKPIAVDPEGIDLKRRNAFKRLNFIKPIKSGRGLKGALAKSPPL